MHVEYNTLITVLAQSANSTDRALIKLNGGADTVYTLSKNHGAPVVVEVDIMSRRRCT